jgi:integrase/recombinase XerD
MIRRRAAAAGIAAEIGCHTFRATAITAYLSNGGALEHAQEMAAHESPRTLTPHNGVGDSLSGSPSRNGWRCAAPKGPRSLAR